MTLLMQPSEQTPLSMLVLVMTLFMELRVMTRLWAELETIWKRDSLGRTISLEGMVLTFSGVATATINLAETVAKTP